MDVAPGSASVDIISFLIFFGGGLTTNEHFFFAFSILRLHSFYDLLIVGVTTKHALTLWSFEFFPLFLSFMSLRVHNCVPCITFPYRWFPCDQEVIRDFLFKRFITDQSCMAMFFLAGVRSAFLCVNLITFYLLGLSANRINCLMMLCCASLEKVSRQQNIVTGGITSS